jgi:hypothetical protein
MQPHTPFKRYIAALTVGGLIMALLFFALPSYAAALPGHQPAPINAAFPTVTLPGSPIPTPTAPPRPTPSPTVQQQTSISGCPGVAPTVTIPSIEFCSPRFKGDAEGPYGTHITLLGRDIPGRLVGLYLLQVPIGKSPAPSVQINNTTCVSPATQCFPVDNVLPTLSQIQNTQQPFKLSFNWTIGGADSHKDYYAVLAYRDHDGKTHAAPAVSPFSFTLLSQQAPCIIVSSDFPDTAQDCPTPDSTLQLTAGSTVYLHGENWYPGDVSQKVKIKLSPCPQQSCQGGRTFPLLDATPDQNGTFTEKVQLNPEWNNAYILASNYMLSNVIPVSNVQGLADGTLTSGYKDRGDATALRLNIVRPCIMVTLDKPSQANQSGQAPPNCTQSSSKPVAVTAGESFYLQGFYWLTSQGNKVTIQIICTAKSCPGSKLKSPTGSFTAQQGTSGYFYQAIPVPADSAGTYTIKVNQDGVTSTSSLQIQVNTKPPVINTPSSTLPLLALLPAVISLLLYIITQRRRTMQATAATQRMPGNPVPTTPRASLTPPVTRQPPGSW